MEGEQRLFGNLEQQPVAERYAAPAQKIDLAPHRGIGGSEIALFVEFAVVRQVGFRDHTQDAATLDDDGAVEQEMIHLQRRAHDADQLMRGGSIHHLPKPFQTGIQQRFLMKQVVTGVRREAQLGENYQYRIRLGRVLHQQNGFGGVVFGIGHAYARHRHGDAGKVVVIEIEEFFAGPH